MPLGDFMRTEFFEKDTFQFWVGPSEAGMDFSDEEFPSAACSLAGLILVRHRFFRMGRKDDSRIALVDKVVDERTGIVLANSENLPTYRSLLRRTRKDLVYEARYVDGQGQDCRPSGLRMTEAAAEAIARGEKYWVRPDLESARRRPAP
jgi:hypothetical protein